MLEITNLTTWAKATCEEGEIAEAITPWYEDAPAASREEVMQVIQDLQDAWGRGGDSESAEQYLGIKVEYAEEDIDPWPSISGYHEISPREQYKLLTRCDIDKALHLSGEMGHDTVLVRQAFILRALGAGRLEEAQHGDRKTVAMIFREAHGKAHELWLAEQDDIYSGDRLTGPAVDAVRQVCGMSNRELAHDLKVDERTVRAWTKGREGYATPPIGVTEELTAALDAEIEAARALIGRGKSRGTVTCPVFTTHDDPALVRVAVTILAAEGRRFNIDPLLCVHDRDAQFCPKCFLGW